MLYDEVLEVPERRFDAGGFAPPPRFSRAEGLPQKRAADAAPQPRFDDVVDYDLRDDDAAHPGAAAAADAARSRRRGRGGRRRTPPSRKRRPLLPRRCSSAASAAALVPRVALAGRAGVGRGAAPPARARELAAFKANYAPHALRERSSA